MQRRSYAEWKIGDATTVRAIEGGDLVEVKGFDGAHQHERAVELMQALTEATSYAGAPEPVTTGQDVAAVARLGELVRAHEQAVEPAAEKTPELTPGGAQ